MLGASQIGHVINARDSANERRAIQFGVLLLGRETRITISHKGRLRIAELEQQRQTGRDREEFGILLAGRYWERGIRIALLRASNESPVAVAFLDSVKTALYSVLAVDPWTTGLRHFLDVVARDGEYARPSRIATPE